MIRPRGPGETGHYFFWRVLAARYIGEFFGGVDGVRGAAFAAAALGLAIDMAFFMIGFIALS